MMTAQDVIDRLQMAWNENINPMSALEAMYDEFQKVRTDLAAEAAQVNYANHPKSIAEIKAAKADDGGEWKPRDALIAALRDTDSGAIKPTMLVVVYHDEIEHGTRFYQSGTTRYETVGMLHYAISAVKGA